MLYLLATPCICVRFSVRFRLDLAPAPRLWGSGFSHSPVFWLVSPISFLLHLFFTPLAVGVGVGPPKGGRANKRQGAGCKRLSVGGSNARFSLVVVGFSWVLALGALAGRWWRQRWSPLVGSNGDQRKETLAVTVFLRCGGRMRWWFQRSPTPVQRLMVPAWLPTRRLP